jgi:peptide alpha-N-acetyltransferase
VRKTLLTLKPTQRNHWLGYALSHHLDRNFAMALKILETFEKTLTVRLLPVCVCAC